MLKKFINFIIKYKWSILIFLFTFLFWIMELFALKYKVGSEYKYFYIYIGITIILSILVFFINKKVKTITLATIPQIFLWTSLFLGGIYLILSPIFTGSDEHNHYFRIYEISNGVIFTPTNEVVGSFLPASLSEMFIASSGANTTIKYKNISEMYKINLNKNNTILYGGSWVTGYDNTALYSPVQYLPHVVGFSLGKAFNLGPYILGILGRIFNLLFYVIGGYFCLKIIPKGKLFYFFILMSPNMLQCATTLSADAFTNIIFLLLLALIFKAVLQDDKISFKDEVLIFLCSVIISLCKIVYLPAVFLVLFIDKDKFSKEKKEKVIFSILTILVASILGFLWIKSTDGVFAIAYNKSIEQKRFILNNLIEYALIFARTMANYIASYIECLFVGTTMYHSQLKMPAFISLIYIIIVLASLFYKEKSKEIKVNYKVLLVLLSALIIGLISTAIYVQCTAQFYAVKNPTIEGIQGRYFIPVIMLIPFIFSFKKKDNFNGKLLYSGALVINLITWFYMINQFLI